MDAVAVTVALLRKLGVVDGEAVWLGVEAAVSVTVAARVGVSDGGIALVIVAVGAGVTLISEVALAVGVVIGELLGPMATPTGNLPTGIVAITSFREVSMTETVLSFEFVT